MMQQSEESIAPTMTTIQLAFIVNGSPLIVTSQPAISLITCAMTGIAKKPDSQGQKQQQQHFFSSAIILPPSYDIVVAQFIGQ